MRLSVQGSRTEECAFLENPLQNAVYHIDGLGSAGNIDDDALRLEVQKPALPIVHELERKVVIPLLDRRDHALQLILALAAHPHRVALDL